MKKFKKVYIEITNICNLSCSFCPKTKRTPCIMSCEQFKEAIDKTKYIGDNFYLHVMGEPLSHNRFVDILDICMQNNLKTNITTNGTLIKKQGDEILKRPVRMVSISLHSFEANCIDKYLSEYLFDIVNFCKKSMDTNVIVELRLWNMDRQSIYDKNKLNCQILDFLQQELCLDFNLQRAVEQMFYSKDCPNSRKRNLKLLGNIYIGTAEHFDWPDIEKATSTCRGFCYGLRNQIAILCDGTVVPCCLDSNGDIPLGNIFESSIEQIISSARAKRLYDGFTAKKAMEPLCTSCGYMKKFI